MDVIIGYVVSEYYYEDGKVHLPFGLRESGRPLPQVLDEPTRRGCSHSNEPLELASHTLGLLSLLLFSLCVITSENDKSVWRTFIYPGCELLSEVIG